MTVYTVEFTSAAARELRKLDPLIRRRVLDGIAALQGDPRPPNSTKLVGADNAWRIRVGDYRVLYEVADALVLVTVFKVGHRREVYEAR
ncbi:type II toxin-antitoxin system RelE family toxin [Protaetiibacter larvae]|uniref:Type II toxin-antitoxin system RelE/ParE family toxin n=1 Tax=Protaetiibacter larvae TaxID=2592654 RepID=A0A5C1Y9P1_9MICO|nr:type II toxin-antitoxin system RelE/ParE family toxin [Protaetiibacter larvae]QEO10516.1 type II toxin-antitoxin system RelE/ParE family toxin [Protaetiibacter larvae]